jgi:hypothetical protein
MTRTQIAKLFAKNVAMNLAGALIGIPVNRFIDGKLANVKHPGRITKFYRWNLKQGRNPYFVAASVLLTSAITTAAEVKLKDMAAGCNPWSGMSNAEVVRRDDFVKMHSFISNHMEEIAAMENNVDRTLFVTKGVAGCWTVDAYAAIKELGFANVYSHAS